MPAAPSSHDDIVQVFGKDLAYKWVVAIVYVSALFLDILDTTIVNVALPVMQSDLHTDKVEWVVLGYTLSLAVWIPTSGWLGDRFGTKRTFLFALAAFGLGSAACGFAQTIGQLIAFRVLQGVGGGMLTPVGVAMLFRAFPPAERAKASSVVMVPMLIAPAAGPLLGGVITEHFDWRWIFWVNVPLTVLAIWFGWRHLREHREPSAQHFDVAGFVLSAAALALIVYSLSEGWQAGWTSALVLGTGGAGVLCAILTVMVELRVANPMLDLRLFQDRMFRICNTVGFFSMASFLGVTFVLPLYLQNVRGLSPLGSGLATFPQALGTMASSFIAGRAYARFGPRRLMFAGFLSGALVTAFFLGVDQHTSLWAVRALMLVRGFCIGFAFVPMQAASYSTIPPAQNGRASSIFSTQRQVGVSVGVAVMASVMASFGAMQPHHLLTDVSRAVSGVRWSFALSIVLALVSAGVALRVPDDATTARAVDPAH